MSTGIHTLEHMEKLKDDALVGTSVRLVNEYDFPYPEGFDGKTVEVPQVHFIYKNAVDISIIVPVFQNEQEIVQVPKSQRVDRIFDVKTMLQFQVPTMDGEGCITKVIRQCLFLHCKEPVFAVSKQSSRCSSSQFLIVAAHTSDTCSKTCSAVPCLRHSYILTAILRAYIRSLWIPSLLFAEKQRKI